MSRRNRLTVCAILGCLLFAACADEKRQIVTGETAPAGWGGATPVILEYVNSDTLRPRDLYLLVRRRNDFAYDRLNLLVLTTAPDGRSETDTLSVALTGPEYDGAEAASYLYTDYRTPYRTRARLDRPGTYRFRFVPLMSEVPLEGIIGVGIEIVKK
jgi:gliding motility-associated lipoprotein GldH